MSIVASILTQIEESLASVYDFRLQASVQNHLLGEENMVTKSDTRGQTIISHSEDEMFIGVHLNPYVLNTLETNQPEIKLDNTNLDAFCVAIEEVSHFHLLVNRACENRTVSELELEWQGEVDKLLICATILRQQYSDAHYLQLARMLYDQALIQSTKTSLYEEATKYAARFWFDIISYQDGISDPMHSEKLKAILRQIYRLNWHEKLKKFPLPKAA